MSSACIQDLFEAQVIRTPGATALIYEDAQLTYQELDEQANQLAHLLSRYEAGPDTLVGIFLPRSIQLAVSLLAVLKAGRAFLPLDAALPAERLSFFLRDAQISLVITEQTLVHQLPSQGVSTICLDKEQEIIASQSKLSPARQVELENLAYVIYTSGSTGQPKGVLIPHRGIVNHSIAVAKQYQLQPQDRILQFASFSFDVALEELFPSWISGSTVVMRPAGEITALPDFLDWVEQERLTVLNLPTAYWHEWAFELSRPTDLSPLSSVRLVIIGGEAALSERVAIWQEKVRRSITLYNAYGPTETTITATLQNTNLANLRDSDTSFVPIGKPIENVQTYLLDPALRPVSAGAVGELYIGGEGLARGYLNHPELTAEYFLPHPFAQQPGLRLYRTGDFARFLPDGTIEFLGRRDQQVKIRGHRIELEEIEISLRHHPSIREAVVIAHEEAPGEKRLIAYLVANSEAEAGRSNNIQRFLSEQLPAYMLPATFIWLEALPLTTNGKVDRRKLPPPQRSYEMEGEEYVAPHTSIQQQLAAIWMDVLRLDRVGIYDSFFALGGHSLAATRIISRIRQSLQKDISLRIFFSAPNIANLAERLEEIDDEKSGQNLFPIQRAPRNVTLPLSFAQESVWFIQQLAPTNLAYSAPATLRITGKLNVPLLERCLNTLYERHEVLRTTFPTVNGKPLQVIHPSQRRVLPVINLQQLPEGERDVQVQRLIQEEIRKPFDLTQLPLIRWTCLKTAEDHYLLLLVEHHFVHDGWSTNRLLKELFDLYKAFLAGLPSPLPDLPIQFADFAFRQRQWVQGNAAARQLDFWKRKLAGSPALLDLPTDRPRPPIQSFRGAALRMQISSLQYGALKEVCRREEVTLYMILLAALFTILYRYSGQEDICVGSGIANRRSPEMESVIGMVINTIVLRIDLAGNPSFQELLKRVRDITLDVSANQDLPFEKVVEAIQPERNPAYNPLFQVMFGVHDAPLPDMRLPAMDIDLLEAPSNGSAKFDINVIVIPRPETSTGWNPDIGAEGLTMIWEYNTDIFDASTIERMTSYYQTLLAGIIADPRQRIANIPLLSARERDQLLMGWNTIHPHDIAEGACIHEIFAARSKQVPDGIAVVFENQQISYQVLEQRTSRLAYYLQTLGVGPDVLVGIYMERSLDMIIALLGILKAGGAYMPLDPTFPEDRIHFMLQDAGTSIILTQERLARNISRHEARVVCLDDEYNTTLWETEGPLTANVSPDNLAYIIYTSGSTGRPKGVGVCHRQIAHLFQATQALYRFSAQDCWTLFHSIGFDFSVWEIWGALFYGGRLLVVPYWVSRSPEEFRTLLLQEQVTVLNQTPSAFYALQQVLIAHGQEPELALRLVIFGGEALDAGRLQPWMEVYGDAHPSLVNMYGITETTIHVTYSPVAGRDGAASLIGKPLSHLQLYLLDAYMQPVPPGMAGEIYVGGAGLARGYSRHPDLTAERFVPHPFSNIPGARLYRTGDLAYSLPDGTFAYRGRIDQQVKLRGFRIELGEIKEALLEQPQVQEAVVLLREMNTNADQVLVAYIVPKPGQAPTVEHLRFALSRHLPNYMIPAFFIWLKTIPLTASGKIDQRALPLPAESLIERTEEFVAPQTPIQEVLASVWANVLGLEQVGIHDNFFTLGGDSIRCIQVLSQAQENNLIFSVQDIFMHPTIEALSHSIDMSQASFDKTRKINAFDLLSKEDRKKLGLLKRD